MRLTLRTLLAWLDDTLPPDETREIGHKVAESESAQELISRIRQVTRRRRLTTPVMGGSPEQAVDANTVAEYLDNVLPPDKIAELEKICLDSDVNLAEVAACHQILTVILGEPAKVPPTAYQRMYGLVRGREAIPNRRPPVTRVAAVETEHDAHDEADEALLLGMPAYQRRTPLVQRIIPVAVAVLLVVCLLGIMAVMVSREPPYRPVIASAPTKPTPPVTAPLPPEKPTEKIAVEPPSTDPVTLPEPAPAVSLWAGWVAKTGDEVTGPGVSLASVPMWSGWVAARPSLPVNLFLVYGHGEDALPSAPPVSPPTTVHSVPPPNPIVLAFATYSPATLKDSVPGLLIRQAGEGDWRLVRPEKRVNTGELLISLPGYRSDIILDNRLRLSLVGNLPVTPPNYVFESAAMLHDSGEVHLDLTLERGRIMVANKPVGESVVRLRFLNQVWDVKLLQPASKIGVELTGRVPRGAGAWKPHTKVTLIVTGGDVELTRAGKTEKVTAGKAVLWDTLSQQRGTGPITTSMDAPSWMKDKNTFAEDVRLAMTYFSERVAGKPKVGEEKSGWVQVACEESMGENAKWQRWIGVFSLGAIDQLRPVVHILEHDTERHDMRFAAVDTLIHWLGRRADRDRELRQLLRDRGYSSEDTEVVVQLLRGHDQIDTATVRGLVSNLNHPRLPLRELSYINLNLLNFGDKLQGYSPLLPADQRERAVEAIEARLLPK
jgi:hypothetical protein